MARMVWPLPALLTWLAAWALLLALRSAGLPPAIAFVLVTLATAWPAWRLSHRWRRLIVLAGFPLSFLALVQGGLPAWAWLAPLGLLLLLYPLRSWRDAPLFPTPAQALADLARAAPLPAGARVLEAGCGLGHGLRALHRAYPEARLTGLEWSAPLTALCRLRCGFAQVRRGDIWTEDWSGYEMVYLFQRPESMPRAVAKARRELKPGAWLVSLEFEATELTPVARLETMAGKPVWLYRAPWA